MTDVQPANVHNGSVFVRLLSKQGWRLDDEEPVYDGVGRPEVKARLYSSESPSMVNHVTEGSEDASTTASVFSSKQAEEEVDHYRPTTITTREPSRATYGAVPTQVAVPSPRHHAVALPSKFSATSMEDSGHYGSDEIDGQSSRSSSVSSGERPKLKGIAAKRNESERVEKEFDSFVKQNAAAAIQRTEIPTLPPPPPTSAPPKPSGITMNFPPQQMWKWKQKSTEKKVEHLNVCLKQKPHNDKGFGFSVKGGTYQGDPVCLSAVIAGSRADRAGLEVDDEIVTLEGMEVEEMPLSHVNLIIKEAVVKGELEMTLKRFKVLQPPPPSYHITSTRHRRPHSPRSAKGGSAGMARPLHHKSESSLISPDSGAGSALDYRTTSPYSDASVDEKGQSSYIRNQNDKASQRVNRLKSDREWAMKQRAQSSSTGHLNEAHAQPRSVPPVNFPSVGRYMDDPVKKHQPPVRRYQPGKIENFVPDAERSGFTGSAGDYAVSALHSKRAPGRILDFVPDSERPKTAKEIEYEKSSKLRQENEEDDVHWEKEREFILESFGHADSKGERVLSPSPIRNFRLSDHTSRPLSVKTSGLSPQPPTEGKVMQSGAKPHSPKFDDYKPRSPTPSPRSSKQGGMDRGKSPASFSSSLSPHSSPMGAINSSSNYSPASSASPSRPLAEEIQRYGDKSVAYEPSKQKPTPPLPTDSTSNQSGGRMTRDHQLRQNNESSVSHHKSPLTSPQREQDHESPVGQELQFREEQLLRARNELLSAVGSRSPNSSQQSDSSVSPRSNIQQRQQDPAYAYLNGDSPHSPPGGSNVKTADEPQSTNDDGEICFSKMPLPWEKQPLHSPSRQSPRPQQEQQHQQQQRPNPAVISAQSSKHHDNPDSGAKEHPQTTPLSASSHKPGILENRSIRTPSPSPAAATSAIPYHPPMVVQRVEITTHKEPTSPYQNYHENSNVETVETNKFSFDFNQSRHSPQQERNVDHNDTARARTDKRQLLPPRDQIFSPSYTQMQSSKNAPLSMEHDRPAQRIDILHNHDAQNGESHSGVERLSDHQSTASNPRFVNGSVAGAPTKYIGDPALDYLNFEQKYHESANPTRQQESARDGYDSTPHGYAADRANQQSPRPPKTGMELHKKSAAQFLSNRIPKGDQAANTKYQTETHWLVQEAAGYHAISEQMNHERSTVAGQQDHHKSNSHQQRTQPTPPPDYYNTAADPTPATNQNTHWAKTTNHLGAHRQSSHSPSPSSANRQLPQPPQNRSAQSSPRPQFPPPALPTKSNGRTSRGENQINEQLDGSAISVSGRQQCSHCGLELGRGAAMIIESLNLFYHLTCFHCYVCATPLGSGVQGTDVRVRNGRLHCQKCYSNDETGLQFSEV